MAIMALVPWPTSRCKKSQCQSEKLGFLWKSRGTWIEEGCETRWLWFKEWAWEFPRYQLTKAGSGKDIGKVVFS